MSTSTQHSQSDGSPSPRRRGVLDVIEWLGNLLPDPVILFIILASIVVVASAVASAVDWRVQPIRPQLVTEVARDAAGAPILDAQGKETRRPVIDPATGRHKVETVASGEPLKAKSLLTSDGIYWALSNMVRNFVNFPPLGLVLTSMLGIGLAERVGLFSALMRWLASITPRQLLSPAVIFIGCNASIASDAGYIILPPLAAGLYAAMGRQPVAGIAAAFAGVAGGFGAGFLITGADAVLAGVATTAAGTIDDSVRVLATTNWFFKAGSVGVLTIAGWIVTDRIVEPRLARLGIGGAGVTEPGTSGPVSVKTEDGKVVTLPPEPQALTPREKQGLLIAAGLTALTAGVFMSAIMVPGWALYGTGIPHPTEKEGPRWSQVIVPMMFFISLLPGLAYGLSIGVLKTQKDFVDGIFHAVRTIAPVIAMAFFAAQFIEYFKYSNLDKMLAYVGGDLLMRADLPTPLLLVAFVLFIIVADFAISSMTAKFTALAPILIPMFLLVGVSPDLTIAAYRIGDSVVNTITPLNTYLPIILLFLQRYRKDAGLGSLMSLMMPYSVTFAVVWTGFLLLWYSQGWLLGPGAHLHYVPR